MVWVTYDNRSVFVTTPEAEKAMVKALADSVPAGAFFLVHRWLSTRCVSTAWKRHGRSVESLFAGTSPTHESSAPGVIHPQRPYLLPHCRIPLNMNF